MFDNPLIIKKTEGDTSLLPYQMLQGIKKSKYPDITDVSDFALAWS